MADGVGGWYFLFFFALSRQLVVLRSTWLISSCYSPPKAKLTSRSKIQCMTTTGIEPRCECSRHIAWIYSDFKKLVSTPLSVLADAYNMLTIYSDQNPVVDTDLASFVCLFVFPIKIINKNLFHRDIYIYKPNITQCVFKVLQHQYYKIKLQFNSQFDILRTLCGYVYFCICVGEREGERKGERKSVFVAAYKIKGT